MAPSAPRAVAPEASPLGAAPWVGADAGPACPLCLRALKGTPLAEHLAAVGHSAHDAACERCHKHFSTFEALTEHLYGARAALLCLLWVSKTACGRSLQLSRCAASAPAGRGRRR